MKNFFFVRFQISLASLHFELFETQIWNWMKLLSLKTARVTNFVSSSALTLTFLPFYSFSPFSKVARHHHLKKKPCKILEVS